MGIKNLFIREIKKYKEKEEETGSATYAEVMAAFEELDNRISAIEEKTGMPYTTTRMSMKYYKEFALEVPSLSQTKEGAQKLFYTILKAINECIEEVKQYEAKKAGHSK